MYFVYVIKSLNKQYTYIGLINDLNRRISEHNNGHNKTTKPYKPFRLIYQEKFQTRAEARLREKYLKSECGREYIKLLPEWRNW